MSLFELCEEIETMIINESNSYHKGDKVKVTLPDTLDIMIDGIIDHKASTKEINDAGWENCTANDNFYVVKVKYKGKDNLIVSPANGIHESIHLTESKSDLITRLEREGKLNLNETEPGSSVYRECSGKSLKSVQSAINKFNKNYDTAVICWEDRSKGAIYVES